MKKDFLKVVLLLFFAVLISSNVEADNQSKPFANFGEIEGKVVDCEYNPLPDHLVYLNGVSFMARTDAEGYFRFINVPEGSYQLVVEHPSLLSQAVEVVRKKIVYLDDIVLCPIYVDADGDGYTPFQGDCDDGRPDINPDVPELCCDGIDNNCNGLTDEQEGCEYPVYFIDSDGDGFGAPGTETPGNACTPPEGYAYGPPIFPFDCDDGRPDINPSVPEICCDGIDNNCDGLIDEEGGCEYPVYFIDSDDDGFGVPGTDTHLNACPPQEGYTIGPPADCNDDDPTIHPGAPEICADGWDNNCDGIIDEIECVPPPS